MRQNAVPILAILLFFALTLLFAVACDSGSDSEPYRECLTDADCGEGFRCEFQECKRVLPDGDVTDGDTTDGDSVDGDEDLDEETEPEMEADAELEAEPELPTDGDATDGDATDGDEDAESEPEQEGTCNGVDLDPRCSFLSESYCRDGAVDHSVLTCKANDELYFCIQDYDPCFPTCGYTISERYQKTCREGCVANEDPNSDDYCEEDGPPNTDGDITDGDDDIVEEDVEQEAEWDTPRQPDGKPCQTDSNCLPGHVCQLDWDDDGRYCARDRFTCVDHVGLADDADAIAYGTGDIICHNRSHKRCLSVGAWSGETLCPPDRCVSGYLVQPGQDCVDREGCVPWPPDPTYPCPGNFACYDEYNCRGDCLVSTECAPGYICVDNACIPN